MIKLTALNETPEIHSKKQFATNFSRTIFPDCADELCALFCRLPSRVSYLQNKNTKSLLMYVTTAIVINCN